MKRSQPSPDRSPEKRVYETEKSRQGAAFIPIRVKVMTISGEAMAQAPPSGLYPNVRRTPRFAFDALVGVVVSQPDKPRQFWSRSTDISQGGIGVNLIGGDVNPDQVVSLQTLFPSNRPPTCGALCVIDSDCTVASHCRLGRRPTRCAQDCL